MSQIVQRWDEWFAATHDEESIKTWEAAKSVHTDEKCLDAWEHIIECNRLDRIIEESRKTPPETP